MSIEISDILGLLPHRYPFLLIDRVLEVTHHAKISALKNVTVNEPFFLGHFPQRPIMPGVLIIEAMAQAAVVLVNLSLQNDYANGEHGKVAELSKQRLFYLTSVEKAVFRQPVIPGDTLLLEVTKVHSRSNAWRMQAIATVNGNGVAEAAFTAVLADSQ